LGFLFNFQIFPKFSSGAIQDGGTNVNYFVASISASFGQNFHFSPHKMAENQQQKHSSDFELRQCLTKYGKKFTGDE